MFARVFALLPLALLVSATHLEARDQCNASGQSCCNQVQSLDQANSFLSSCGLVDVAAAAGGLVGLNCSPLTIVGAASSCQENQQPVCCSNNDFNGLVNLGCSPLNIAA